MIRRRANRSASTIGSDRTTRWPGGGGKDVGKQLGRRDPAGYLGRDRRSGRRTDDQIGLGRIQPGLEEAGDDADLPRVACRSGTAEDQRSLAYGGGGS